MLPDRVSNLGSLTYESGALPIALRGPATGMGLGVCVCVVVVRSGGVCKGAVRSSSESRNGIYYWDYRTTSNPSQMIANLGWDPRWHDEERTPN